MLQEQARRELNQQELHEVAHWHAYHLLQLKPLQPDFAVHGDGTETWHMAGAATEDLKDGLQQTASKLACIASRDMREFCSQVGPVMIRRYLRSAGDGPNAITRRRAGVVKSRKHTNFFYFSRSRMQPSVDRKLP